jgi:hypothetical protein
MSDQVAHTQEELVAISINTRALVDNAATTYDVLVNDVAARFKWDTETSIVMDLMVARIAYVLAKAANASKTSNDALPSSTYIDAATAIYDNDKKGNTYTSQLKWVNRLRTAAGFPSENPRASGNKNRGADRKTEEAPAPIASATAPIASATAPIIKLKVTEATSIEDNIHALVAAANKLLSENAGTIHGAQRDCLVAMMTAGRVMDEALRLEAQAETVTAKKPSGKRREAVIELAKRFNSTPVAELAN